MPTDSAVAARAEASVQRARGTNSRLRLSVVVWLVFAAMGVYLIAFLVALLVAPSDDPGPIFNDWVVAGFEVLGSVLCLVRGIARRPGRLLALTLGAGLLMWALGDVVTAIGTHNGIEPPTPSLADVFFLAFFPFTYVAVVIYLRGELRRLATPNWLDGAVAGVGAGSVVCSVLLPSRAEPDP